MQDLSALWVGGELSYIERLCLTSMLDTGHKVTLYTYHGVPNAPSGVDVRDGREIMPERLMIRDKRKGSYALGADLFRYYLLQRGLGTCWTDCDMLFLKPLPQSDYIFGWERPDSINNAVLKLPPESPILSGTLQIAFSNPMMLPWWGKAKRARRWIRAKLGVGRTITALPWGALGPRSITHFAHMQCIAGLASPYHVFYPNPATLAPDVFNPLANIQARIQPGTIAVHLWNTEIRDWKIAPVRSGSFIDQQCVRLGIERPGHRPLLLGYGTLASASHLAG